MQLKNVNRLVVASLLVTMGVGAASGQSLAPMHNTGNTPSDVKGFKLVVGNPYPGKMTFVIIPMDTKFVGKTAGAVVSPSEVTLAPNHSRTVVVQFKIDPKAKERTIGVCVLPKDIEGPVLPRVCGTYTGVRFGTGS